MEHNKPRSKCPPLSRSTSWLHRCACKYLGITRVLEFVFQSSKLSGGFQPEDWRLKLWRSEGPGLDSLDRCSALNMTV